MLVIAATVWGLAASAGSLRDAGGNSAQVTGNLPGQTLWTYYNTLGGPTGAGDNIITLVNPNGTANPNLGGVAANTCAMIYVFDDDQEMGACCGCPLTPAGIETFSVENDFAANWGISGAAGQDHGNGSIAIVAVGANVPFVPPGSPGNGFFCPATQSAACNGGCDPTNHPGYSVTTATNLLGSIVHNQTIVTADGISTIKGGLTESPLFDNGTGDPTNLAYLQAQCGALVGNGTGGGICQCPRPDPDAAPSPHPATPTLTLPLPLFTFPPQVVFISNGQYSGTLQSQGVTLPITGTLAYLSGSTQYIKLGVSGDIGGQPTTSDSWVTTTPTVINEWDILSTDPTTCREKVFSGDSYPQCSAWSRTPDGPYALECTVTVQGNQATLEILASLSADNKLVQLQENTTISGVTDSITINMTDQGTTPPALSDFDLPSICP
jgi:hypothetical protein